jgi:hypothetical protein
VRLTLFDLGNTLEAGGRPRDGAHTLLAALPTLRDGEGKRPEWALLSDYDLAASPAEPVRLRRQYLADLRALGLERYFRPTDRHVTLSTEVGVYKPDARLFHAALDKVKRGLPYDKVVFVTENASHVRAARTLGMLAVQVSAPRAAGKWMISPACSRCCGGSWSSRPAPSRPRSRRAGPRAPSSAARSSTQTSRRWWPRWTRSASKRP